MKVRELVALLQQTEQDAEVVTAGYGGGFARYKERCPFVVVELVADRDTLEHWACGPFEEPEYAKQPRGRTFRAIVLT